MLKRERPLTIAGPPSLKSRFAGHHGSRFPGTKDLDLQFPLMLQELEIGKRNDFGALAGDPVPRRAR